MLTSSNPIHLKWFYFFLWTNWAFPNNKWHQPTQKTLILVNSIQKFCISGKSKLNMNFDHCFDCICILDNFINSKVYWPKFLSKRSQMEGRFCQFPELKYLCIMHICVNYYRDYNPKLKIYWSICRMKRRTLLLSQQIWLKLWAPL